MDYLLIDIQNAVWASGGAGLDPLGGGTIWAAGSPMNSFRTRICRPYRRLRQQIDRISARWDTACRDQADRKRVSELAE